MRLEIAREVNVEGPEVESIPVRAGAAIQRVGPLVAVELVGPVGASEGVCAIRAD